MHRTSLRIVRIVGAFVAGVLPACTPGARRAESDVALAAPPATELRELVPGMPIPGAARLHAGSAAYVFYSVSNGARQLSGTIRREIAIDRRVPRGRLTVVQHWQFPQGATTDTSVLYLDTMEPITFHGQQREQSYSLDFSAARVQGVRRDGNDVAHRVDVTWASPFYNEVVDEVFAAAQPLATGFGYAYVAYNPGDDPRRLTVRVVGSEKLPVSGGDSLDAWIVEQRGIQQLVVRWWFAKATHEELRMRVTTPDGGEYGFYPLRVAEPAPRRR